MEFFDPIQSINKSQLAQAAQLLYLPCLQHVTTYTRDKTRAGQGCQDKSHHRSCHMLSWDTVNSSQGSRRFGHLIHPPQKSCYPHESGLTPFFKLHVSMGPSTSSKIFSSGYLIHRPPNFSRIPHMDRYLDRGQFTPWGDALVYRRWLNYSDLAGPMASQRHLT